jgi:5'-nucleotidase
MNKRLKVGFDLDSTLNTLDTDWLAVYNRDYNDSLTRDDIVRWEIDTIVKPECGRKIFDYLKQPGFFANLGVREHAYEVTQRLIEYFDIYIVTAYYPSSCLDKCNWISKNLPHIPLDNIIFINNKGLLRLDALVDDGGHNITAFAKNNPDGVPLLFDAPWNRYLADEYIRTHSLIEAENVLLTRLGGDDDGNEGADDLL